MKLYGLIGFPLTHSFSKKYFSEKFLKENIQGSKYELFEIPEAGLVKNVVKSNPELCGLNVTIPHKQAVMQFLDELDPAAAKINAVNVIKVSNGKLKGYNSDYYGFKTSLEKFIDNRKGLHALVLGTGGAAKAVVAALDVLEIPYQYVSRSAEKTIKYSALTEDIIKSHKLIINTSPLGMSPKTDACPEIPYQYLTNEHYLFDLVYNPEVTLFMKKGEEKGAKVKNGLEMLYLQAEKAWEIWNS